MDEYLSLEDMLDQDPSAYEYFQTLPSQVRDILEQDGDVTSFEQLQSQVSRLKQAHYWQS